MANLFEQNRNYVLGDDELNIIGDRDKLAQWRHKGMGPAFYKLPTPPMRNKHRHLRRLFTPSKPCPARPSLIGATRRCLRSSC